RPLERLAAEQLQDRVLGRRLPLRELREAEVTERLQRELIDPGRRDEVALAGVEAALLAEGDERVDDHAEIERVVDPQHRALVRERTHREPPAVVEITDEVLAWHEHIREE